MKPALLLIDLQRDYLALPRLEPSAGCLVAGAAELLARCRQRGVPVIFAWTTVHPACDDRMPHWRRDGRWMCVQGSPGHAPPEALQPYASEIVVHKRFFSAFEDGALDRALASLGCDTVWIAGVHLHGCVRATALDAYQRGLRVCVAEDAVGSDDPVHAAITRRYLAARSIAFGPGAALLAGIPCRPVDGAAVESAVADAHAAGTAWRTVALDRRLEHAQRLAELLQAEAPALARQMAGEIGKPVRQARAEVLRGADLVRVAARWAREPGGGTCGEHSEYRDRPLGVVAAITPWNNPVAIPLAKIVAALLFGNAVVWKPAPAVAAISARLHDLIDAVGFPPGLVRRVCGDAALAGRLMSAQGVAAVSLTGSLAAGRAAQEICARRNLPLQAELGGNNAAIVWPDCDLDRAATLIAEAAFGFAGQRCTATRRVIIEDSARAEFLDHLATAVDALVWGDPLSENTDVGPLVSATAAQRIAGLVARAQPSAQMLFQSRRPAPKGDAFFPPTVFACDDALAEIVQEESFGPVLVVQPAHDFEQALSLCNGVPHGLVAALLSRSPERQTRFLDQAQAGILKLGSATADADVEAPFGGWKASGVGPPEHGRWDRSFFTRAQAVYRRDG